jgi:protein regulator of cytokinesis 1
LLYSIQERRYGTLREQVAAIGPHLEELRKRKEGRTKKFLDVKTQMAMICGEIAGSNYGDSFCYEEQDLTTRKLEEYHAQLATLQKEKVRSE